MLSTALHAGCAGRLHIFQPLKYMCRTCTVAPLENWVGGHVFDKALHVHLADSQIFKLQARVHLGTGRFSTALERVRGGPAATLDAGSAGACHLPPSTLQASS